MMQEMHTAEEWERIYKEGQNTLYGIPFVVIWQLLKVANERNATAADLVAGLSTEPAELARLREERDALLEENNNLRRDWLQTVSHDVVFAAEVNEERGIDLAQIPISEATLAALNIGIDRENYRLRAENERLRAALKAANRSLTLHSDAFKNAGYTRASDVFLKEADYLAAALKAQP